MNIEELIEISKNILEENLENDTRINNLKKLVKDLPDNEREILKSALYDFIEIVGEAYRLAPSEDAPAGALGCDVHVKIPGHEMKPIKLFLRNSIAEDIAWNPYGQMIADEIVFECIRPEYEKLKQKL